MLFEPQRKRIGTVYLLLFKGIILGVIGAACGLNQMSIPLWSFVAPHGVLELPAIFIAGGAGLRVAQALLFPGALSRRDSLAIGGAPHILPHFSATFVPFVPSSPQVSTALLLAFGAASYG